MIMSFVELTAAEARAFAGGGLNIPDAEAMVKTEVWGKGTERERQVVISTWDEIATIVSIEPTEADPTNEKDPFADLEHEKCRVTLKISDKYPSENKGRQIIDFMDFYLGLKTANKAQLKEWKDTYAGTEDPKRLYQQRFFDTQKACTRMAQIVKVLGYKDKLQG